MEQVFVRTVRVMRQRVNGLEDLDHEAELAVKPVATPSNCAARRCCRRRTGNSDQLQPRGGWHHGYTRTGSHFAYVDLIRAQMPRETLAVPLDGRRRPRRRETAPGVAHRRASRGRRLRLEPAEQSKNRRQHGVFDPRSQDADHELVHVSISAEESFRRQGAARPGVDVIDPTNIASSATHNF